MKKIIYCFILLFISFSHAGFGQGNGIEKQNNAEIRIESVEKELKIYNEVNTKILQTVYWALGGLGAIFLTVIGLNFFQNFKLNQAKINNVEANLKNLIHEEINSLVKKEIQASQELLQKKISNIKDELHEIKRGKILEDIEEWKEKNGDYYIPDLIELLTLDIKKDWDWRIMETLTTVEKIVTSQDLESVEKADLQTALEKLTPRYAAQKARIQTKI